MITIIEYQQKYKSALDALINQSFGDGYSSTKNYDQPNYKTFVAVHHGALVGACSAHVLNEGVVVFDFIVVVNSERNKGIGDSLFKHRLNWVKKFNPKIIRINHWIKTKQKTPVLAIKFGFKQVAVIEKYWMKESLTLGYGCDECKSRPCVCSCAIYELALH